MSDHDTNGQAWVVPPSEYAARRPARWATGAPRSQYLTMPDGCRLALDWYLPEGSGAAAPPPRSR